MDSEPLPPLVNVSVPVAPVPAAPVPAVVAVKHSGLGVSSFVISVVGGFVMFILFGVAGVMETATPGGIDEKSSLAVLLGLLLLGVMAVHLLGVGLAIGGLVQKDRKKVFSVLGLVFNLLVVIGATGVMIAGQVME